MKKVQEKTPAGVYYAGYDRELAKQSVGSGWHGLLDEIFDKKESLDLSTVNIVQVKEKYAGLRVYIDLYASRDNENDPLHIFEKFLHDVERRSLRTCEVCGEVGAVRGKSWYYTSCNEHAQHGDEPHEYQFGD
jgi:hypothetical protein